MLFIFDQFVIYKCCYVFGEQNHPPVFFYRHNSLLKFMSKFAADCKWFFKHGGGSVKQIYMVHEVKLPGISVLCA